MEKRQPDSAGRYHGFKGHFDQGVWVFESKEERDRYQVATYGRVRDAYRLPDEPTDDRPTLAPGACRCRGCRKYGGEFWADASEELTYLHAVESNPKGEDEGALSYMARIAGIVQRRKVAATAKSFPPPERLSPVQFHKRQVELDAQREPARLPYRDSE